MRTHPSDAVMMCAIDAAVITSLLSTASEDNGMVVAVLPVNLIIDRDLFVLIISYAILFYSH
jgi:hypothetical protein